MAELGSGPRDGIMLLIIGKTGWSIQRVRSGMGVLVLILGYIRRTGWYRDRDNCLPIRTGCRNFLTAV